MPHAVVLQPPPGNLAGPSAAPAYLKSYAQEYGYNVQCRDVGIEAFYYLSDIQQIHRLIERSDILLRRLEDKGVLEPLEQRWYGLLLMATGFGLDPGRIADVIAGFKDETRFHDYARYKLDCKVLDAFFRLLRAVCYPTMVTPWDYPSVHALKSEGAVRLHLDDDINPFVSYYREALIPEIAQAQPDVVGISMVYATQSVQALILGMLLKQHLPGIHVTMGGAYLTQWALQMQEEQYSFLFRATDSVICGEGEVPFVRLLEGFQNGAPLADIPNLIYREEETGRILQSPDLVFTDLAEQAPPDFSDLDLSAYLMPEPVLPYMLTRGCYWQRCGFCQNRIGKYRPRPYQSVPVEKAVEELSGLSEKHNCRHFHFCSDVIDPDYLATFSARLLESKVAFFWHTNLRAEKNFSRDFCGRLAEAGLTSVSVGMESGCQSTLDAMDKGLDIFTLEQTLEYFYDSGVATQVTGIFGFPGEFETDARLTVEFLQDHIQSISGFDVQLLLVQPGMPMHNDPSAFRVNLISYDQNRLMTPEPLWKAARRIGLGAVNRLFEQLGHLEAATCLINDHPYVGALCSNHSFLYFTQGPYILKRLRSLENIEHQQAHRSFGMDHNHRPVAGIEPKIPRFRFPYTIYRSPYLHERAHFGTTGSYGRRPLVAGPGWDYLLDPINVPQQVTPEIQQIIDRIDGRRDLEAVLEPALGDGSQEIMLFLISLVMTGLIELADKQDKS
jgi:anaerobic magnesium-protoporphyrin IX monomethyl ester cyclase